MSTSNEKNKNTTGAKSSVKKSDSKAAQTKSSSKSSADTKKVAEKNTKK